MTIVLTQLFLLVICENGMLGHPIIKAYCQTLIISALPDITVDLICPFVSPVSPLMLSLAYCLGSL